MVSQTWWKNYYSKRNPSQGEKFLLSLAMFVNVLRTFSPPLYRECCDHPSQRFETRTLEFGCHSYEYSLAHVFCRRSESYRVLFQAWKGLPCSVIIGVIWIRSSTERNYLRKTYFPAVLFLGLLCFLSSCFSLSTFHLMLRQIKSCLGCNLAANNAFQMTKLEQTAQARRKTVKSPTFN